MGGGDGTVLNSFLNKSGREEEWVKLIKREEEEKRSVLMRNNSSEVRMA